MLVFIVLGIIGILYVDPVSRYFIIVSFSFLIIPLGIVFFTVGALIGWGKGKFKK